MKTEFNTASLKKAFALVEPATTRNSPLSILKSVRLRFAGMDATDTIVQITAPVDAVGDPINVCVPVDKMAGILSAAGDTVAFEHKNGYCTVKTGRQRFKVAVHDGGDFPVMAEDAATSSLQSTPELHAAIGRVMFAAAKHDVHYYLNAVMIECRKDVLHVVATNGFTMATVAVGEHHTTFNALLHRPVADVLSKWKPGTWSFSPSQVVVETEDAKMVAKLVIGKYPDWTRVFPTSKVNNSITLPRAELLQASTLSRLVADNPKAVRSVRLQTEGNATLKVSAAGTGGDKIDTDIGIIASAGEALDIVFNGDLLEPALRAISPENVEFRWVDQRGSVLLEDGDFRSLIMPYRV